MVANTYLSFTYNITLVDEVQQQHGAKNNFAEPLIITIDGVLIT